jgi:MFS family permease
MSRDIKTRSAPDREFSVHHHLHSISSRPSRLNENHLQHSDSIGLGKFSSNSNTNTTLGNMGGPSGIVASSGNEVYKTLSNNVNPSWIRDKGLRRLNFAIGAMFASAAANGYDGSLINGLLAMPYFNANLGDPASTLLGITLAGISLGGLPSFIPASYVSDYLGRRITVAIGSSIMLAAAIIQCATSGVYAFLGTRIMLGVGLGFAQTAAPPLTAEIAHPKHRANITNMFQAIWFWGAIVSAVMSLGFLFVDNHWSWRIPCLFQGFFPAIQLIGLIWVPESPRWLVSKNRHQEALRILARYHANGDVDDQLVQFEYQEICSALELEKEVARSTGWSTFFATKGNRHRLLICVLVGFMIQWAGNGIVSCQLKHSHFPVKKSKNRKITDLNAQTTLHPSSKVLESLAP